MVFNKNGLVSETLDYPINAKVEDSFNSDFGNLTASTILSGKSQVTSNAKDQSGQKITTIDFTDITIEQKMVKFRPIKN